MPTPFIMPKFDMDQETATVVEWSKQEGDHIEIDELVLVVETDKVAIDVPSPATGTLARITARPGDTVPVTTVIAFILAEDESLADLPQGDTAGIDEVVTGSQANGDGQVLATAATPVAARMARELGIDLTSIAEGGDRVTKADIEQYLDRTKGVSEPETGRVAVPATPAARRLAQELALDLEIIPGSGPRGRVQVNDVKAASEKQSMVVSTGESGTDRPAERLPLTGIRRTIAQRMQSSFQTAPHIALTVEVDVGHLEQTRQRMNNLLTEVSQSDRIDKVTLTALLVRIVAWALARHSLVNASLIDDEIYLWKEVNVGVATAIEDGLIVPVIHNAAQLSVGDINTRLRDLAQRARAGQLALEEVQGGTFTISNLGMFGINQFRAIINPPESAILAVGRVQRKPIVVDESDTVAVRPVMTLTLSADHRVINGVVAAQFLADVVKAIETPDIILL